MPKLDASALLSRVRRWLGRPSAPSAGLPVPAPAAVETPRPDPRVEVLLLEWQDVRESIRHCMDHALAQLGIFLALSAMTAAAALFGSPHRWAEHLVAAAAGMGLCALFQTLHVAVLARARGALLRGTQIETAVQLLVPGVGHVKSLALCSQSPAEDFAWVRRLQWTGAMLHGATLLGWMAVLIWAALSSRP